MAKKKFLDTIKTKQPAELRQMVKERREILRSLRFDLASGKVKNSKEISKIKKEIAQILTLENKLKKEAVTK